MIKLDPNKNKYNNLVQLTKIRNSNSNNNNHHHHNYNNSQLLGDRSNSNKVNFYYCFISYLA